MTFGLACIAIHLYGIFVQKESNLKANTGTPGFPFGRLPHPFRASLSHANKHWVFQSGDFPQGVSGSLPPIGLAERSRLASPSMP